MIKHIDQRQRYRALDSYRFIAASLIVLFHYNGDFGLGIEKWTPAANGLTVMVDFFFVLSGFVIAITYGGRMASISQYILFLRRRFARIYPLHLATLLAFVGLAVIHSLGFLPANHPEILDFKALPANFLLLHAWGIVSHLSFNAPSWSISAEWLAYLLFPALLFLIRRLNLITNLLIIAAFSAAMMFFRGQAELRPWTEAAYDFGALRALPSFFLGIFIANLVDRSPILFRMSWPTVHMLFVLALVTLHFNLPRELTILTLASVVACAAVTERVDENSILTGLTMTKLGDASYAIYMIHVLCAIPVLFALRKINVIGTPIAAWAALATYGLVVFFACVIYMRFESPMRRWLGNPILGKFQSMKQ